MTKTILVTGANRGLGLGFVRHYIAQGHRVIATVRDLASATSLTELQKSADNRLVIAELDVTQQASIEALASRLASQKFDLLINNAGIARRENLGHWTAREWETVLQVNVVGPALVAQMAEPLLAEGAKIVALSSGLGSIGLNINPEDDMDAYSASKAALNMTCRRMAEKLRNRGVIVAAISPGWVRTDMGGGEAELSVEESIRDVAATIERLEAAQSGGFFDRTGQPIPW